VTVGTALALRVDLLELEARPDITYGSVTDVATDDDGRIHLLTRSPSAVLVYGPDGAFERSWGDVGLVHPHGITIHGERAYLVDQYGHVVRVCDLEGRPLGHLGRPGVPSATGFSWAPPRAADKYRTIVRAGLPFNNPTKAAVAPDGSLLVTDGYGNARVHRFSPDRTLVASWGEPGSAPGQFRLPHGLCVLADGRVVVADRENDRLQCFHPSGHVLALWPSVQRPTAVVPAGMGLLVAELGWNPGDHGFVRGDVTTTTPSRLALLDLGGTPVARVVPSFADGRDPRPHGLSAVRGGRAYVACLAADQRDPLPVVTITTS